MYWICSCCRWRWAVKSKQIHKMIKSRTIRCKIVFNHFDTKRICQAWRLPSSVLPCDFHRNTLRNKLDWQYFSFDHPSIRPSIHPSTPSPHWCLKSLGPCYACWSAVLWTSVLPAINMGELQRSAVQTQFTASCDTSCAAARADWVKCWSV